MRLSDLQPGQSARIRSLRQEGARLARLLEMGLLEGAEVTLIRRAPLGDPLELKVGDGRLSLRAEEARWIEVEL